MLSTAFNPRHPKHGWSALSGALLASIVLASALAVPVSAQETQASAAGITQNTADSSQSADPIGLYRQYEAAFARNDLPEAATLAVAAWRAGELAWPQGNPNLPGLAYNAGWTLTILRRHAEALEPSRRALALAEGNQDLEPQSALLVAFLNLRLADAETLDLALVRSVRDAAQVLSAQKWDDELLPVAWHAAAHAAGQRGNWRLAGQIAGEGIASIERVTNFALSTKTAMQVIRARSLIEGRSYRDAVEAAMQARRGYGPPVAETDSNWAQLAAWEAAARALALSGDVNLGKALDWPLEEAWQVGPVSAECLAGGLPERRKAPGEQAIRYPASQQRESRVGGAIVRARLDATGAVTSVEPMASIPNSMWAEAAATGIRTWAWDLPDGLPESCRFVVVTVMYVLY